MHGLCRLRSCIRHLSSSITLLLQFSLYSTTQNVSHCNSKITALSRAGNIDAARQLFDNMPTKDIVTWNALLTGYWQNGFFHESRNLFESMAERNIVSWNSMITGCIENDMIDDGLEYFRRMPRRNVASWNTIISGLVKCDRVDLAIKLSDKMPYKNVITCTAMIDGYLQKGMIPEAKALFDDIPQKNSVTWTVMISGYVDNAMFAEARDLFQQMPVKTVVASTAMITGFCKEGKIEDARHLFDQLRNKDCAAWNALITGYSHNGCGEDALKLFLEMIRLGIQPNKTTFVSIFTACSSLPSLKEGGQFHSLVLKYGFGKNLSVCNALLSMYSKCGDAVDCELAFSEICSPDVVSWNTIIAGFAHHGLYEKACAFFNKMCTKGFVPNAITFLSMLSACGHAGKVDDSMAWFDFMVNDYGILPGPEHYACLADILCRRGQLDRAYRVIQEMPFEGNCGIWGALLSACLVHSNAEIGVLAAKKILELDPHNCGVYVMLSNIYARCGMWKEVAQIRRSMKEQGVKKLSGCSWTQIGDKVHSFVGGGVSHAEIDKICSVLNQISLHGETVEDGADLV